jgi:3-oxo-5-alpha-steroid 4-dehydrogenase 1
MMATGVFTFAACMFLNAPYGRYSTSKGWGVLVPAQLAWFIMESPNLWTTYVIYCVLMDRTDETADKLTNSMANQVLLGFFCAHYVHRSIIYPFRMRNKVNAPMPLSVMLLAFGFCFWNGTQQALSLCMVNAYDDAWLCDPRFIVGMLLAVLGMCINVHSDSILLGLSLRNKVNMVTTRSTNKPTKKKYVIPTGGMFEYVSAANYSGEILEWFGFALACWSLPALAFALYTLSNIGPRGYNHHQWYLKTFGRSYPPNRKAVIPFVW